MEMMLWLILFDRFEIPADVMDTIEAGLSPFLTTGRIPLGETCGSLSAMSLCLSENSRCSHLEDSRALLHCVSVTHKWKIPS